MGIDELVDLTEVLLEEVGLSVETLRSGNVMKAGQSLTDEQFQVALRFLAGERPVEPVELPPPPKARAGRHEPDPPPRPTLSEEERDRRIAALVEFEAEEEVTPAGFEAEVESRQIEIASEFGDIKLK